MAMTPEDFRAALARLGMPQEGQRDNGADAFLGVDPTTVRRWASGRTAIPDSVEMLFRIMLAHKWKPDRVRLRYCKGSSRAGKTDG
jgi:DNA-binding transcriptional regulator YdaS (Cro superfamily)